MQHMPIVEPCLKKVKNGSISLNIKRENSRVARCNGKPILLKIIVRQSSLGGNFFSSVS